MASSRSLHTVHLAAFGAGNVVGLGVMSMAGIGVGITGTGLWLAALVGGLGGAFALVPQLLASSSGDYPGGQYQQVGTLLPPVFGGIVAYILCFLVFDISAYALSAAQLLGLPMLPTRLTAALVVALFLGVHMLGARIAAIAQLVMAVLLAAALGTYVAVTMPHVRLANLAHYTFLGSPLAFLFACVYMTFMMNGVAGVANYAAVADRPRVTVPRAMRVSLLLVAVTYALICVADAGALPIAQVANQDLAVSLSAFVPAPVTVAFVVGGSAFALLTTLNAAVGCMAYPVASACTDGWLPRELGERSARTGAPVRLLSVGMIAAECPLIAAECPLIAGNSAKTVSSSVTILMIVVQAMVAVAALRLILRDGSSLCAFRSLPLLGRVPQSGLAALCIVALLVDLLLIAWLLYTMNRLLIIGNVVIFAITVVAAVIVNKYRVDTRP